MKYKNNIIINNFKLEDKYNIFNTNIKTKYKQNLYSFLSSFLKISSQNNKLSNIPKELFLTTQQVGNMIISEIEKINHNMDYPHYIVCNNDNLMDLSIRLIYNKNELGNIMNEFNKKHGYNYFEINIKLSNLHPYLPPDVYYNKPSINSILISSIIELDIWKTSIWNYTIPLEWIVINLANSLEQYFIKYIDINDKPLDYLEIKMIELKKNDNLNIIPIKLMVVSNETPSISKYKSGIGYESGSIKKVDWDISKYIDVNKNKIKYIINILNDINKYINKNPLNLQLKDLYDYVINKFDGINLLEFNKNIELYKVLIETLDIIITHDNINISTLAIKKSSIKLVDEIKMIINNAQVAPNIEEIHMCVYLYYLDVIDKYYKYNTEIQTRLTDNSDLLQNKYIKMIKEQCYNELELTNSHRFYNKKDLTIAPKSIVRIMGEIASLKNDLPINWDSSVIMRYIPDNINMLSFIISGPKDTPYHNGLFEFHAYFPNNYPHEVPQVLLNTTGGGTVRFNPNLYSCGKVCLSLLGTWQSSKSASWIPEVSTFYQVIISIQSLIFVDEPYFNEPGYQSLINTEKGNNLSSLYNDNIRYETVRVAMLGVLNNKHKTYETFITEHFKMKKDEIIETVNKWYKESKNKIKFKIIYDELVQKLNEL